MAARLRRIGAAGAAAGAILLTLAPSAAEGRSFPLRTFRVSDPGPQGNANGPSGAPAVSGNGLKFAFQSNADSLGPPDGNGAISDIYIDEPLAHRMTLVSVASDGGAADGASLDPALSGDGSTVAFVSSADNLVSGDTNGRTDVFARRDLGAVTLVSGTAGGGSGDGDSGEPDASADGRRVAFSSTSTNLVPGDTNGRRDVFVRDVAAGTTTRVSVATGGGQANADSSAPSISADGRYVSFYSTASNLVGGDTNGTGDVFVHDLATGATQRVSVASSGRQQNAATGSFAQVSDVSAGGRFVVFDSDATNLVRADTNRHTDVFLRDRATGRTSRVSLSSTGGQGDNDSFYPSMSPNGRFVIFESFAENLASGDAPREDVFLRDVMRGTTSVVDVTATGSPRGPEQVKQLLQRAAISDNGEVAAFESTAGNLVANDANGVDDVFGRVLTAPATIAVKAPPRSFRGRPTVEFRADDPHADRLLCRFDGVQRVCRLGRMRLPTQGPGRHVLEVAAGGPGMLFDQLHRFAYRVSGRDRTPPSVRIAFPHSSSRRQAAFSVVRGRAGDAGSGVAYVQVAVATLSRRGCQAFNGRAYGRRSCTRPLWVRARGTTSWSLSLPRTAHVFAVIRARAVDFAGNRSAVAQASVLTP